MEMEPATHSLTAAALEYAQQQDQAPDWVRSNSLFITESSRKHSLAFPGVGVAKSIDTVNGPNNLHSYLFASRRRACWTPSFLYDAMTREGEMEMSVRDRPPQLPIEEQIENLNLVWDTKFAGLGSAVTPAEKVQRTKRPKEVPPLALKPQMSSMTPRPEVASSAGRLSGQDTVTPNVLPLHEKSVLSIISCQECRSLCVDCAGRAIAL
eukprot:3290579-Rhodomonas_salina.2